MNNIFNIFCIIVFILLSILLFSYDTSSIENLENNNVPDKICIDHLCDATTNNKNKNIGLGQNSLTNMQSSATSNVALGIGALENNKTGGANIAIGSDSLKVITSGGNNTAIGDETLMNTQGSASSNTAVGSSALSSNSSGEGNTAVGQMSLKGNTSGSNNIALGSVSLLRNTTGKNNTVIGYNSGISMTKESYNTLVGNFSNVSPGVTNCTVLGNNAHGKVSNGLFVPRNISSMKVSSNVVPLGYDKSTGQIGPVTK